MKRGYAIIKADVLPSTLVVESSACTSADQFVDEISELLLMEFARSEQNFTVEFVFEKGCFMPIWLHHPENLNKFTLMLDECETFAKRSNIYSDREREFIQSMREKFWSRQDQEDMGVTPWSPTSNQWNYLKALAEKAR